MTRAVALALIEAVVYICQNNRKWEWEEWEEVPHSLETLMELQTILSEATIEEKEMLAVVAQERFEAIIREVTTSEEVSQYHADEHLDEWMVNYLNDYALWMQGMYPREYIGNRRR